MKPADIMKRPRKGIPFCAIGFALALSACGSLSAQDEPALAAYWDFNDASNPDETLDKLFGFQGLLEEGATFATGQSGNAIDFGTTSAGQRIFIDEVSFLNMAAARDQISISFWQSLHNVANSSAFWGGSPSSTGSERGIQAHTPWGDGNIYFDTAGCCDAGTQRISGNVVAFEPDFATGWHHLVFIKNGSAKQVWVNGQLFLEGNNTLPLPVDFDRLVIGAELTGGNSIQGIIDEFAVFVGALSPANIAQLAEGTPPDELDGVEVLTDPIVSAALSSPTDVTVTITDSRSSAVNPDSLEVLLDGEAISSTVAKVGNQTTIHYNVFDDRGVFFTSGGSYALTINLQTTDGDPFTSEQTFTVAPFATIPADYALAADPTSPGWVVTRVHQMDTARGPGDGNSIANAEMQLADGMVDAEGNPRQNLAENAGPVEIGGDFSSDISWTPYVNWEQAGSQIDAANPVGPQPDNFNLVEPTDEPGTAAGDYANRFFPGVDPGMLGDPDNFVVETIAYIHLTAGLHRWGVNSDDGFKVTVAPGQPSPFGLVLGQFATGRGASDTIFDFVVEEDGFYPIRLLHWEGGGGANCEWFSVDLETGQKILIGDTQWYSEQAYEPFRTGQGRAYVSTLRPSDGFTGTDATGPIFVEITDGRTQASNARLLIEGEQVATGTKAGNVTTINYTAEPTLTPGATYSAQIVYDESGQAEPVTHHFTFEVRPFTLADLPSDTFWIEAEDWDHGGGQTVAAASTMPYAGGAYEGLAGVLNVDYFDDNAPTEQNITEGVNLAYRTDQSPNHVNITVHEGTGVLAIERPGGFTMTTNYRLGWTGNFWGNYTRTLPEGNYRGVAALSHGSGVGTVMEADLDRVTDGVGTASQTLERLGTFIGSGSGGWGSSVLVPLKTPSGADAVITMPGGPVTLRVSARNGDFDWFALVPTTDEPPVDDVRIDNITITPGGQLQIEWTGDGTLQSSPDLPATDWTDITSTSPATLDPPAAGNAYFRVRTGE
jgi:hypothetical protein